MIPSPCSVDKETSAASKLNLAFGGSFNPIHRGHVALAEALLSLPSQPNVFVIPSGNTPLKATETLLPPDLRLQMVRLAMPSHQRLQVLDIETFQGTKSYTYHTLCQLHDKYSRAEWGWVLGTDAFQRFADWYRASEVAQLATLLLVRRQGVEWAFPDCWAPLQQVFSEPDLTLKLDQCRLGDRTLAQVLPFTVPDISATSIREGQAALHWVPDAARPLYVDHLRQQDR
jgi:nicotinate (nicotinamide) nucleotide adenylyltransferase